MVTKIKQKATSLYDTDYNLWVIKTVKQLENREVDDLDWENLIEEVLSLSRRDKKKLKSLLKRLFEHLLKLKYWESEIERNKRHWKREIRNFRQLIQNELKDSPSFQEYILEIFDECYENGKQLAADASGLPLNTFPETPIPNLEQILDENWLP